MITWLDRDTPFPPVTEALRRPNGLLAAGADLSPERLIVAYSQGIFPWFSGDEPILWWSPDPRMALIPAQIKISRSLKKTLRRGDYEVRLDSAFAQVMRECAAPRAGQDGTWITPAIQAAYLHLHELGHAHSVEVWIDGALAGGLYGVAIGRAFFGESMFSRVTGASKIAFAHLSRYLERKGFAVIDCQMETPHLASLGAQPMPRQELVDGLKIWTADGEHAAKWPIDGAKNLFADDK